jgi:site-specific recombinase XerD
VVGEEPSISYFKHNVFGLLFLFLIHDLKDKAIKLSSLKKENKLPLVLSPQDCKLLFKSDRILKHRVLLSFINSVGLRLKEVHNIKFMILT